MSDIKVCEENIWNYDGGIDKRLQSITYQGTAFSTVSVISKLKLGSFGGLGVACWPLVPKFAGSNPAEAVGFLRQKNPQHAFLQRGSKAVGPMS